MKNVPEPPSAVDLQPLLRAIPGLHLYLTPSLTILDASDDYLASTLYTRKDLLGKYVFDAFPTNSQSSVASAAQEVLQSLQYVLEHRLPHTVRRVPRYDLETNSGHPASTHWQFQNKPVLDTHGEVLYLIHSVAEITSDSLSKMDQENTHSSVRALMEAAGGVSWDYDVESRRFYWSKSYETIFGYPVSEEGETPEIWDARVHPEEYESLKKSINQAIRQKQKVWTGKYRFLKANGSYTNVLDHGFILYNQEGEPYRMLGTLVDIDLQQETERTAKENLERLELMSKATNDVIWDWDLTDDTIWWNDGFKTLFGYKPEDIETSISSWYDRVHPEDSKRVIDGIHEAIDNGSITWQDEYCFKKADGTYADILDRGFISRNEEGQALRMIGAMLDITEKNRYAASLRESEQHVKALLEGVPEIAWVARADGQVYYYNKAWYSYTGNSTPEEGWESILHPDDFAGTTQKWSQSLQTGQEYMHLARLKRAADGQFRWFSIRATPLQDNEGAIQAWIGVNTDIQEQKDIQQSLIERDEYVQRMLAQAPVQFAVLKGQDWTVDFATPQFKHLTGGRDSIGKPFREALPELEEQGFFQIISQVYETGELHRGQETPAYLDRKGTGSLELGYFDFVYQPLFNEQNQVEGVMMLIVEVTEQVNAKQQAEQLAAELKAAHDRIIQILDALPHMTFTSRPDGYVDYYSQQWYDFLGGTRETLSGWGWENYIHPEDLEKTNKGWQRSLSTGEVFVIENRWRAQEGGEYRWFLVRSVPMRDNEGNIIMWVGSHTDIHDQKQNQLALQESKEHFQFLADSMPQLVWTTDQDGYHDYFNQKWEEYTGYDLETSKGDQMWNNLVHPDDQERSSARWRHSLLTGEPYQVEYRFRRATDGQWRWFLGRALPLRDQDGNIVRWFGTCTDIEDQKRDEECMEQTNRELRSINEDLDSFVYTASHDLKLPIINMAGIFQELTKTATFHDPDAELLIQMFDKSLKQINATISDLSEIVKVQKEIDAHQEKVELSEMVEEVKLSIKDMLQTSQALITTNFTQAPALLYSRVNLKSIFYNLISNAVKYRAPDRVPLVHLQTYHQNGYIVLTVQDNGLGMDLEKHSQKMFQMFKRFHDHVEGSGLGLYILNRIIQKNGGRIEVESEIDNGTTFTIYFKNNAL